MRSMKRAEWGMLLLLSTIWGGSFFLIEIALRDFHPFTVVFFRVATASVVLVCALYLLGQRLPSTLGGWWPYLVLGALNNAIPFSLISWGQTRIDSGSAAIFNATTPIFAGILAHFFTADEKLVPRKLVGMLVGFSGVYLMLSPELKDGLSWRGFGQIAVLGAALMYALGGIFSKRFKGVTPLAVATGMLVSASVFMLPLALAVDWPWPRHPSAAGLGALATLAVLGTALAYVFFFRILAAAGAVNVLLVTFLVPVGAIVLGVVVLREVIRWQELAGMGLIFLGLAAIDGRVPAYLAGRRKTPPPERR